MVQRCSTRLWEEHGRLLSGVVAGFDVLSLSFFCRSVGSGLSRLDEATIGVVIRGLCEDARLWTNWGFVSDAMSGLKFVWKQLLEVLPLGELPVPVRAFVVQEVAGLPEAKGDGEYVEFRQEGAASALEVLWFVGGQSADSEDAARGLWLLAESLPDFSWEVRNFGAWLGALEVARSEVALNVVPVRALLALVRQLVTIVREKWPAGEFNAFACGAVGALGQELMCECVSHAEFTGHRELVVVVARACAELKTDDAIAQVWWDLAGGDGEEGAW
jgi:hypothetical protein